MCCHDGSGCHGDTHESRHFECHSGYNGICHGYDFPPMSIEEEVEELEETKKILEKRLETVNKRLEVLRR